MITEGPTIVKQADQSKTAGRAGRAGRQAGRPWYAFATPVVGKCIRALTRMARHGGSAFPGKVVEQLDPGFLLRSLSQIPYGVILVSGTNGKTTTTRMVSLMLEEMGLRVFTNPTGSNFTRGVVSALLTEVGFDGSLHADIAVLELDEAYAVHFVRQTRPRYSLLLNVMRDQLDRFGEIDTTARLLGCVAEATSDTVVLNREDNRIRGLASLVQPDVKIRYFGLSDDLRALFPSDDDMYGQADDEHFRIDGLPAADVLLTQVGDHQASFCINGQEVGARVKLEGVYNLYNAAAALSLVRAVMSQVGRSVDGTALMRALSTVTPAFGRGETMQVKGSAVELLLVKNPMGFRLSLLSFTPAGHETMIAIGDQYADGRDMSWLWDVDFRSLRQQGVTLVSGARAWDMTLRLGYDQVPVGWTNTNLEEAVDQFIETNPGTPKRIYCTYTSMLRIRARLSHMAYVSDVGVGR